MNSSVPNEWHSLRYVDPKHILVSIREIERDYPIYQLRYSAASLRTRELRQYGEGRQAALFCYGMGLALGTNVRFAQSEHRDHDVIARFELSNQFYYVPIQLKEWVPQSLNQKTSLQSELDKLSKYVDAADLTVAFYLNRNAHIDFSKLQFPSNISELWFFGAIDRAQTKWSIFGNLLDKSPQRYEFFYPTV